MTEEMKSEIQKLGTQVLFDERMDHYTTIRVGGPADALLYPASLEELEHLVLFSKKQKIPLFVFGAGSNLLIGDQGIRGLVVNLQKFSRLTVEQRTDTEAVIHAEVGVGMPRLVDLTAEQGLHGLEGIAGVPGNVGGGLAMNAGTREGQIGDAVLTVSFMDKEGKLQTWSREDIGFGYRTSHFPKGAILLSARFGLTPSTPELVKEKVKKMREARVETQPLNVPNLGSVFKNPPGQHAGALVEEAGLKGVRVGGARISPKHGNFIVNEGGATAREIKVLIGLMKDKVKEKFNVTLEPEVRFVGEA